MQVPFSGKRNSGFRSELPVHPKHLLEQASIPQRVAAKERKPPGHRGPSRVLWAEALVRQFSRLFFVWQVGLCGP